MSTTPPPPPRALIILTRLLRRGCRGQVNRAVPSRAIGSVSVIFGKHASRQKHGVQSKVAPDQGVRQTRAQEDSRRVNRAAGDHHRPSLHCQRNNLSKQQTAAEQGSGKTSARTRCTMASLTAGWVKTKTRVGGWGGEVVVEEDQKIYRRVNS